VPPYLPGQNLLRRLPLDKCQAGFNRLELALVTLVVAVLLSVVLSRFFGLMVDAERLHLMQVENRLKNALSLEMSSYVVRGQWRRLAELADSNPMQLLDDTPENYLGERFEPDLEIQPAGVWLFDASRRVLVYLVRNTAEFRSELPGRARVEYRLVLHFRDNNHDARFDYPVDHFTGLELTSYGHAHWSRND
jgi:hypothetical protein